ncbi:MAG: hypothetical protein HFE86_00960 [Clostridiales bacterium]|nr:hypothetical protein [Clostridiales bacterium]
MNGTTYTVKEFVIYVLKKWWAVLLAVILLAAILGGPKLVGKAENRATIITSQIIYLENNAKIVDQNTNIQKYEDYSEMWMRNTSLAIFFKGAAQSFDMPKFYADWGKEDLEDQFKWFKKQMICKTLPNTAKYEFQLTLPTDAENYDYIHANAQKFLQAYIEYSVQLAQKEAPEIRYTVLNSSYHETVADGGSSAMKYLLLGGVLGGFLAVFVLGVMFLASRKIVSKNMLLSSFAVDSIDHAAQPDYDVFCYITAQLRKSGKKAAVLSSSIHNYGLAAALAQRFEKNGYRLAVADLTGQSVQTSGKALSKEECAAIAVPGKASEAIADYTSQADCLLILAKTPAEDAVVSEMMEASACGVFLETVYKSNRAIVERSLAAAHAYAPKTPVGIAWSK